MPRYRSAVADSLPRSVERRAGTRRSSRHRRPNRTTSAPAGQGRRVQLGPGTIRDVALPSCRTRASPDGIGPCRAVRGGSVEGRRRSREPRFAVRRDAPQHRLAGRWTGSPSGPAGPAVAASATPRTWSVGRYRGLDLTLVKPLTYMNESGLAVRKVLAREHAPLGDLLVVADDFALPFGKLRFREGGEPRRPQRPALDHRRARHREVQPPAGRDRRAGPRRSRPRPVQVRARRAPAPRRAARRRRRRGRGVGAGRHEQGRQPLQQVRAPPGRRRPARRARRGRRPARTPTASAGRRRAGGGSCRARPTADA